MKLPVLACACLSLAIVGCSAPAPGENAKGPEAATAENPHAPNSAQNEAKVDIKSLIGQAAPAYEFVFADGSQKKSTDFAGKTVLLDFWASWNAPGKATSATIQSWHKTLAAKGLASIGVNTFEVTETGADKNKKIVASAEACTTYATENKLTYPLATFGDATAERWGISAVPAIVLIGKAGTVLAAETEVNPETLARVEKLILADTSSPK